MYFTAPRNPEYSRAVVSSGRSNSRYTFIVAPASPICRRRCKFSGHVCYFVPVDRFTRSQRRRALRARAIAALGGRCVLCGYDACPEALDFHHLDPAEKDFDIAARLTSWEALETEIRKCVLLCSRCHRETHAGWHPRFLTLSAGPEHVLTEDIVDGGDGEMNVPGGA